MISITQFRSFIIIFLITGSKALAPGARLATIIWNVGQGQWITQISDTTCTHFDFGGEKIFWFKNKNLFLQHCRFKQNLLFLSHPDLDHYLLLPQLRRTLSQICWIQENPWPLPHNIDQSIPVCSKTARDVFLKNHFVFQPQKKSYRSKNDLSNIVVASHFLIPGDSPQQQEKIWSAQTKKITSLKALILAHHGSRSSTGLDFLNQHPQIKMAFAQARKKKYGHPHKEVIERLQIKKIPLLRTEEWGTILVEN